MKEYEIYQIIYLTSKGWVPDLGTPAIWQKKGDLPDQRLFRTLSEAYNEQVLADEQKED